MPLDARSLGAALNEDLTLHSALCRREAGAFVHAMQKGDEVLVACTQERRLFVELAQQPGGGVPGAAAYAPLRFVNIRETAGWSSEAGAASPKIAALLAAAKLPQPEPVATVSYQSAGRLLIIGELGAGERAAELLGDELDITLFTQGPGDATGPGAALQERRYPVLGGRIESLSGWLGAFELRWLRNNPIDLDLCTRCNACVAACQQDAIGLDYQIDLSACTSQRACVKACRVAGAIDFNRTAATSSEIYDLVLDLRATPAFSQHALPQGYLRWDGRDARALLQLRSLVGEFEKPRFFGYRQQICAHSRNDIIGCRACVDICSAAAISSERGAAGAPHSFQQIKVNLSLCVGCGTCTTLCPSGALSYAYPRAPDQGVRLKTLLGTYARSGGKSAALLLHSQQAGARLLEDLGRAAQLEAVGRGSEQATRGVPARVLPLALWHTSSLGLDLWLTAIAYGASQVWVLLTDEEAPQYHEALRGQMAIAQAILSGLGYRGEHFRLLQARDARDLAALDTDLQAAPAQCVGRSAGFAVQSDKRATLELALDHLIGQAPLKPDAIALPGAASPLGALAIDRQACTLCLSCVSACPVSALQDNPQTPQLRFIEKNCVQCGLCVRTCPEKALALLPRLSLSPSRRDAVLLNEMQPYACVRCGRPFGTLKAVQAIVGKLGSHAAFQGAALERLKMCSDCRVIDLYSDRGETRITEL